MGKKEEIRQLALHRGDLAEETIASPWGEIIVTEMSAELRLFMVRRAIANHLAAAAGKVVDDRPFVPELLACVLDPETREPLFGPEDLPVLMRRNRKTLEQIDRTIAELSEVDKEALEEAKRRFSEAKASAGPSSSRSDSAEPSETSSEAETAPAAVSAPAS